MARLRPLPDRVADQILKSILSRGLVAGQALPSERELGGQFGVSRTVIREAIRSLAGKGIVVVQPGRGILVSAVDITSVRESMRLFLHGRPIGDYRRLHEVRTTVEVEVAGLAAERRSADDLRKLESEYEAMRPLIGDSDAASLQDLEFHRALARCTDNEFFVFILDALTVPLLEIRRSTFGPGGRSKEAFGDHLSILDAIRAGDPTAARSRMLKHLDDVEAAWEHLVADGATQTG
jgi:GntR family transcriptional repressor for pyruvate dehydrogenase complex